MRQRQHMAGESKGAGQREQISGIDGSESEAGMGGNSEEDDPTKGKQGSNEGVPARRVRACRAQP